MTPREQARLAASSQDLVRWEHESRDDALLPQPYDADLAIQLAVWADECVANPDGTVTFYASTGFVTMSPRP